MVVELFQNPSFLSPDWDLPSWRPSVWSAGSLWLPCSFSPEGPGPTPGSSVLVPAALESPPGNAEGGRAHAVV